MRGEPVARYSDPPRGMLDASLWAWESGGAGRPLAALKVEILPGQIAERRWILGLVSLATGPVAANFWDGTEWKSQGPGLKPRAVPGATRPADREILRLAQARDLARRFTAREYAGRARGWLALRLLSRPLIRYADHDAGLRDGALFAFAYGANPDVLLALEAWEKPEPPGWRYGLARLGGGEATVGLDGREVWRVPLVDIPFRLETYTNRWVAEGAAPG